MCGLCSRTMAYGYADYQCANCGDLFCRKHTVVSPEHGGWLCKRCHKAIVERERSAESKAKTGRNG